MREADPHHATRINHQPSAFRVAAPLRLTGRRLAQKAQDCRAMFFSEVQPPEHELAVQCFADGREGGELCQLAGDVADEDLAADIGIVVGRVCRLVLEHLVS